MAVDVSETIAVTIVRRIGKEKGNSEVQDVREANPDQRIVVFVEVRSS